MALIWLLGWRPVPFFVSVLIGFLPPALELLSFINIACAVDILDSPQLEFVFLNISLKFWIFTMSLLFYLLPKKTCNQNNSTTLFCVIGNQVRKKTNFATTTTFFSVSILPYTTWSSKKNLQFTELYNSTSNNFHYPMCAIVYFPQKILLGNVPLKLLRHNSDYWTKFNIE